MKEHFKKNAHQYRLLGLLVILMIVMGILAPGKFLTVKNFKNMGFQMAEFGILAIGMSVVIMTGGINLSIVNSAMLGSIVSAMVMRTLYNGGEGMAPVPVIVIGILLTILVTIVCGMVNGFFVAYVGVLPILVTLGTQTVFNGISLNITRGSGISGFPTLFQKIGAGTLGQIPYTMLIYLVVIIAAYLLIELIESRAEDKTVALIHKAGRWGPVAGAALGVIPQCGVSTAMSNLYAGGLISRGTLLAVSFDMIKLHREERLQTKVDIEPKEAIAR